MKRLLNVLRKGEGGSPTPEQAPEGPFPNTPILDLQYDGTGNILLGRKRFAIGLEWEPLQPQESVKVLAARGQRSGYKRGLYAAFGGQAGFGSQDRQQRRGSLALVTAARTELLGPRWVGAFKINEADRFWWVASVRDGEVFEDTVLADEANARSLLMDALDAPDWTRVIAPEDWHISGTIPGRIEQAFSLKGTGVLRPVDGRKDLVQRVVILSLIGLMGGAGYLYWADMRAQEVEREAELRRMRDAIVRVNPQSYPWANAPGIERFVSTCQAEIERSLFVLPGWGNGPITCTSIGLDGLVSTEWSRTTGRISWLRAATADLPERVQLLEGGARARLERQILFPEDGLSEISVPWAAENVADVVQTRFQSLGLTINLRSRARNLTTTQRQELRAPVYNRHDLSLETSVAIGEYARLLSDVPALAPEALIYAPESGVWTLTAKIYHPPILPLSPM